MEEQIIPNGADLTPLDSAFHKLATSEEWKYIVKYQEEREKMVMQTFRTMKMTDGGIEAAKYQGILIGLYDIIEAVKMAKDKVDNIIKQANEVNKK